MKAWMQMLRQIEPWDENHLHTASVMALEDA
jgi:hypothetical protein